MAVLVKGQERCDEGVAEDTEIWYGRTPNREAGEIPIGKNRVLRTMYTEYEK